MSNEPEAEMAIIKLHKTSFKGAIVTVTKVNRHLESFDRGVAVSSRKETETWESG